MYNLDDILSKDLYMGRNAFKTHPGFIGYLHAGLTLDY